MKTHVRLCCRDSSFTIPRIICSVFMPVSLCSTPDNRRLSFENCALEELYDRRFYLIYLIVLLVADKLEIDDILFPFDSKQLPV